MPANPAGQWPALTSLNLQANGEKNRSEGFLSPRIVMREAVKVLSAQGAEFRPAALRKLVSRFIAEGHTTTADLEPWILSYADPTGETAVRNVTRGGGPHGDAA